MSFNLNVILFSFYWRNFLLYRFYYLLRTWVLLYLTNKLRDSRIPWFRDFSFFLSGPFVYDSILLNISMNANIVKKQIFHKIKYDLKGHSRTQTTNFLFKKFCLYYWLIEFAWLSYFQILSQPWLTFLLWQLLSLFFL